MDRAHRRRRRGALRVVPIRTIDRPQALPRAAVYDAARACATCGANPKDQIFVRSASDPFSAIQPDATPAPVPDGAPTPISTPTAPKKCQIEAHDLLGLSPAAAADAPQVAGRAFFGSRDASPCSSPVVAQVNPIPHDDAAEYGVLEENSTLTERGLRPPLQPDGVDARWINKASVVVDLPDARDRAEGPPWTLSRGQVC